MNLDEAKKLFFMHHGNLFELYRDGYDFEKMNIPTEMINAWTAELVGQYEKIIQRRENLRVVLNTVFEYDELSFENGQNKKFILNFYLSCRNSVDDFSKLLLCETLSEPSYKGYLQDCLPLLKEDIDDLEEKVNAGNFQIDPSYYEAGSHLADEDFEKEELQRRVNDLIKRFFGESKSKKKGFFARLFHR